MTSLTHDERQRVLMMIEQMQREGRREAAIHEAVRRAVREARVERRRASARRDPLSLFRRSPRQA